MKLRLIPFIIAIAISFSCSNLCDRAQPIIVPQTAIDQQVFQASFNPVFEMTEWIPQEWWKIFCDDQLSSFIQQALANNPSILEAQAQILNAEVNAQRIRAALFPYVNMSGDATRIKISKTGIISLITGQGAQTSTQTNPGGGMLIPPYFTQYESAFNFSYDFDIWSKNRNALRAAIGEMQASIADDAFARLSLSISVAQVYFRLQIDYAREALAKELLKNRESFLQLVKQQIEHNLESDITLHTAEIDYSSTKRLLLQIQADIAVNEYQLKAYLANYFDEEIADIEIEDRMIPKVPLPREIPLHLIAHRPDIMAQLWIIGSAGKKIEVAKASFYPDFNLMGYIGLQTVHFRQWFEAQSSYFAWGPAFTLPIFDGGVLSANLKGSEVNYDQAVYQYDQLILNAAREVLESLALVQNSSQQLEESKKETSLQRTNLELTQQRMKYNLSSNVDVLNSEKNVLNYLDTETSALGNSLQTILSLIKALGGGYESCSVENE